METYITTTFGREFTVALVGDELLNNSSPYEYLLILFTIKQTKNDALFKLKLESCASGLSAETKEIYKYTINHFDELIRYLVSKNMIQIINKWSKEIHIRFSKNNRAIVKTLLLVHKHTNFTVKDVLINHIIPDVVGLLHIPTFYISNLSLETIEEDLRSALNIPLSYCSISARRNGRSKGFGFFTCLKYDDYAEFLLKHKGLLIDGRKVVIEQSKY